MLQTLYYLAESITFWVYPIFDINGCTNIGLVIFIVITIVNLMINYALQQIRE